MSLPQSEKLLYEIKHRCDQFRTEFEAINRSINEYRRLFEEIFPLADLINKHEAFKASQQQLNDSLQKGMKDQDAATSKTSGRLTDQEKMLFALSKDFREMVDICNKRQMINQNDIMELRNLPYKSQIRDLQNNLENHKKEITQKVDQLHINLAIPAQQLLSKFDQFISKLEETLAVSKEAKQVADRLGAEHKILNRKLNEALQGQKV